MSEIYIDLLIGDAQTIESNIHSENSIKRLQGGIRIIVDGLVITKFIGEERDKGFRGDFIYYLIYDLLDAIPRIISHVPCSCMLTDSEDTFEFEPRNSKSAIRYLSLGSGIVFTHDHGEKKIVTVEEINKKYPNYPDGTIVETIDLIKAIIDVGERFYSYILSHTFENHPDIKELKDILEKAKHIAEDNIR